MRHTFASLLLSDGVPILYVSRQLGHRDPSITLHVYAHWMRQRRTCARSICWTMRDRMQPRA